MENQRAEFPTYITVLKHDGRPCRGASVYLLDYCFGQTDEEGKITIFTTEQGKTYKVDANATVEVVSRLTAEVRMEKQNGTVLVPGGGEAILRMTPTK